MVLYQNYFSKYYKIYENRYERHDKIKHHKNIIKLKLYYIYVSKAKKVVHERDIK